MLLVGFVPNMILNMFPKSNRTQKHESFEFEFTVHAYKLGTFDFECFDPIKCLGLYYYMFMNMIE
jgi:hypothetical protein